MSAISIVWFRRDLRLEDHPALSAALASGHRVVPVFVHDPADRDPWAAGAASRWWLHHSLQSLIRALRLQGSDLVLRRGDAAQELVRLVRETGATAVHWNHTCTAAESLREERVLQALAPTAAIIASHHADLLYEPDQVRTRDGHYRVFTPYWKACLRQPPPRKPLAAPKTVPGPEVWPRGEPLQAMKLLPVPDWADGLRAAWQPGEAGARLRLEDFAARVSEYGVTRDQLNVDGTSRLSPHLHFGEISPHRIWPSLVCDAGAAAFRRQLGWREFGHQLLWHAPHTVQEPMRPEFAGFPWIDDAASLRLWQCGRTGYPLVDAGMRELWTTGWMHNRARMVAASFLVKDLLIPWQEGARWFWDTLVDADLANNTLGWQWVAGCGADAAPFFRIFNPVAQGRRYDPGGHYVRRWLPELKALPDQWLHAPWEAPDPVLRAAGVALGHDYPLPIIDHGFARQRALAALQQLRRQTRR